MVVIKSLTNPEEDRISQLPDALICDILCHISTKDVVKTSVLSKRWKNIWQRVPGLDLDSEQFETLSGFLSFANSFFDLERGSSIRKLILHISGWGHDGYDSFLNPWIETLRPRARFSILIFVLMHFQVLRCYHWAYILVRHLCTYDSVGSPWLRLSLFPCLVLRSSI